MIDLLSSDNNSPSTSRTQPMSTIVGRPEDELGGENDNGSEDVSDAVRHDQMDFDDDVPCGTFVAVRIARSSYDTPY